MQEKCMYFRYSSWLLLRPINCRFAVLCVVLHIMTLIIVHSVYSTTGGGEYRKYLEDLYERVQGTKDQWPPVQFKEYIKLATVVKVEDFTEEDECTKAMMNGKLRFIMRRKK